MFNTIVQIALGILYGLYLATFAPTSQRQKAHELLTQQVVVPMLQPEPTQSQMEAPIAEPTTRAAVESGVVEDPWLIETTPAVAESQENPAAIAVVPKTSKLLLLPSVQLDRQPTSKPSSRRKTKATKSDQAKNIARASGKISAALVEKNVEQLRSLCNKQNIKWWNAHGSRHLTKTEMLERLTA